jgi:hypothetical protein
MASPEKRPLEAASFSADTLEFIRLLAKHSVRYVIVGGQAVIFHGYARFTGDVDFFYSNDPSNAESLFRALLEFWDGNIPGISSAADLQEPNTVTQFGRPPNRIDLLTSIDGVTFDEAWATREIVVIQDQDHFRTIESALLSLPTLIQNKKASARPKDLDDLSHLADDSGEPGN